MNVHVLTHWGWVMHIYVGKLTIISSDNGLSPGWRQNLNQCWNIVDWILKNKLQWNLNWNSNIFIEENTFENVICEMLSISSRPECVNTLRSWTKWPPFWRLVFKFIFLFQIVFRIKSHSNVLKYLISNTTVLAQIMIRQQTGNKPLSHLPLDEMAAILTDDNFKCIFFH